MHSASRRARWLRGGLVSLLGLLALALPVADLSPRVPDPWGPETLAGDVAVASLATLLIGGGLWLATRDWERRSLTAVVTRTYVVTAVAAVLVSWATALWSTGDPIQYVVAANAVLIVALLTFSTAVVNAQQTRMLRADRRHGAAGELAEELLDCTTDPTFVVDDEDGIVWLNGAAATAFGVDREAAVGRDRDAVVGDALDAVESASCGEEYRLASDGRNARRFVRRRHGIEDGQFAGGRVERYVDVTERRGAVAALESVAALPGASSESADPSTELLDAGRELLDAEYAALTRIEGGKTVQNVRSARVDPTESDSVPALHERSVEEVRRAGAVRTGVDAGDAVGGFEFDHGAAASFEAFVAAPVASDGEVVGVVTFLRCSDEPFTAWERALVDLLAGWAGVAQVAGDRYERALDHERERLEFVNRIVRHNVLNGLNVVDARVELLDVDDPEAAEHLSVARGRIDDMTDLIDTIGAFMDAALSRGDRALEPVPIRSMLAETLSTAAESYDAAFRVSDLPDDDLRVSADELVGEVFENVLSNAVEHNDREEPTVTVWTSRSTERLPPEGSPAETPPGTAAPARALGDGGERRVEQPALTVHVADDGPGIVDEQKQRLLRHGDADLADPGHGFGFYLVREMMESYGGGVRVRDNEPRGTVIELVFPIADR